MALPALRQDPIFVVGPPRSGTTFLQALLATQSGVATFPETHFFSELRRTGTLDGAVFERLLDRAGVTLDSDRCDAYRERANRGELDVKELFEVIVSSRLRESGDAALRLRWIEKTPGHLFHMDEILSYYPEARFVAIFRHPVASVLSRRKNLPMDRGKSVDRLARAWRRAASVCRAFGNRHPLCLSIVKYEDLNVRTEDTVRELCSQLGLCFDCGNLKHYRDVGKQIVSADEGWKRANWDENAARRNLRDYLRSARMADVLRIQFVTGPELDALGFACVWLLRQRGYNLLRRFA